MSDSSIYSRGRAPDRAAEYRAKLRHYEDVLDGREPPMLLVEVRHYESSAQMLGFPRGTDYSLVQHIIDLKGAHGKFGTELLEKHDERYMALKTKRRRLQLTRHNAARRKRQPSPLAVLRFVVEYEEREAKRRGAAAAASVYFNKRPSRISRLLAVAEDCRQWLKAARSYFRFRIEFGEGDENERRALPAILATTEQLLRKLPSRR